MMRRFVVLAAALVASAGVIEFKTMTSSPSSSSFAIMSIAFADDPPALVADFTASVMTGPTPLAVTFTDKSVGATLWAWDFESDGTVDSTDQNPSVQAYLYSGVVNVTLTVTDANGAKNSKSVTLTVTAPVASTNPDPAKAEKVKSLKERVAELHARIAALPAKAKTELDAVRTESEKQVASIEGEVAKTETDMPAAAKKLIDENAGWTAATITGVQKLYVDFSAGLAALVLAPALPPSDGK